MIKISVFGYKHGGVNRKEFDVIYDLRKENIINPYKIAGERTGFNKEIRELVLKNGGEKKVQDILSDISSKNYNNIAIGCIGGRHRSVAVSLRLKEILIKKGYSVICRYRNVSMY